MDEEILRIIFKRNVFFHFFSFFWYKRNFFKKVSLPFFTPFLCLDTCISFNQRYPEERMKKKCTWKNFTSLTIGSLIRVSLWVSDVKQRWMSVRVEELHLGKDLKVSRFVLDEDGVRNDSDSVIEWNAKGTQMIERKVEEKEEEQLLHIFSFMQNDNQSENKRH